MSVDFAFLDSGTGGLPYMTFLKDRFPQYKCVYLADTQNFPYGTKSKEAITDCAIKAVERIVKYFCPKVLIIACNTISVAALTTLREHFAPLQIVGTVPAVKLAAALTTNDRIGLLATEATTCNPYTDDLIKQFAQNCKVFKRADGALVAFIEKRLFALETVKKDRLLAVMPAIEYFRQCQCDTVILGCTHFTHLVKEFKIVAGDNIQIVDSRSGVARHAVMVLKENAQPQVEDSIEDTSFFVTACNSESYTVYKTMCDRLGILFAGILGDDGIEPPTTWM